MKLRKFTAMFLSVCLIAASTSMAAFADEIGQPEEQETEQETIIENATPSDVVKEETDAVGEEESMALSVAAEGMQSAGLSTASTDPVEVSASAIKDMFNNAVNGKVKLTENLKVTNKDCDIIITRANGEFDLNGYRLFVGDKALKFTGAGTWNIYDSTYNHTKDKNEVGWLDSNGNCIIETSGSAIVNIYGGYIHPNAQYGMAGTINVLGGRFEGTSGWAPIGKRWAGGKFPDSSNKPSDKNIDGTYISDVTGGPEVQPKLTAANPARVAQITSTGAISGKTSISNAIADGATIVMLMDLKEDIVIPEGSNVTLNLNGKVLDGSITVDIGAALTLQDYAKASEHTGDYADLPSGGVVTGNNTGAVNNLGTFIMNGGTITGNTAVYGGGVKNENIFTMNGGTITGNTATYGGGVYNNGTMTVSGTAVITDNLNGTQAANNLYLNDNTITISETGLEEDAEIGISRKTLPAAGSYAVISGLNNTDYSENFTSDNSEYEIAYAGNALKIQIPGFGPTPPGPTPDPEPGEEEAEDAAEEKPVSTGSVDSPVTDGVWNMGPGGAWTYRTNGLFKDTWGFIANPFAKNEAERYGWFWFDKYGTMATGWKQINGKWYYFNTDPTNSTTGMLLVNTVTPDGYKVGADGAFIQ